MEDKFQEEFNILMAKDIREFLRRLEEHGQSVHLKAICCLQTMRDRALLQDWEAASPPIDLTIIDEAHHMRKEASAGQGKNPKNTSGTPSAHRRLKQ